MTNQNEMCQRYGICKRIAMNNYRLKLKIAQEQEKAIRNKYNRYNNDMNYSGYHPNNVKYFAQIKDAEMQNELNRVRYPGMPSAEITYAGNAKKFWRAGRPHQQTDLRKLTQEKLAEKQNKYGTVVSGHVNYPGGRIGLFNKRVTNALNRAK